MSGRSSAPVAAVAAALGAATALVSFVDGSLYDRSAWGPVAIVALVVVMGAVVAVRRWPRAGVLVPAVALAVLALVQYLSRTWAENGAEAALEAQRTALYAAFLALAIVLVREARTKLAAIAGIAGGALVVLGYDVVVLLTRHAGAFLNGRLDIPIGYANAQAAVLLLVVWPGVALAERARHVPAGAAGVAAATLASCVALTIQSRGAIVGLAVSVLVVLLALPGRGRRAGALLVVAAATAAAAPVLLRVYRLSDPATGTPAAGTPRDAALAALVAALIAGVVWAALQPLMSRVRPPSAAARRIAVLVAAVAVVAAIVLGGGRAADALDRQWTSFKSLQAVTSTGRLTTGGGNRYDYWRIAVAQLRDHPLGGVGAGNYTRTYFLQRRTTEDVRQPHSLELQVLAETGLVGALPALVFLLAVGAGVRRARHGWVARSPAEQGTAVAALGIFAYWLGHTSVDWLHLLPGLTGAALLAAAVLAAEPFRRPAPAFRGPTLRPLAFAAAALAVASIGVSLVADHDRSRADALVTRDPAGAVRLAQDAIGLEPAAIDSYVVLAAAQARLGRYAQAHEALVAAERRSPHDFIPPVLLGDLAARRGLSREARAHYRRASALNPHDPQLRALADRPLSASASGP